MQDKASRKVKILGISRGNQGSCDQGDLRGYIIFLNQSSSSVDVCSIIVHQIVFVLCTSPANRCRNSREIDPAI